ncbi:hypothetical protein [Parasitella parasitica]|uniref:RGS domain-containing protein n=1 Tax=Parasitella parasitica TaxID=35722 RepID=A0A0B7NN61_9FUNG|nr:hypothetical protein [Parasitella parasitica]
MTIDYLNPFMSLPDCANSIEHYNHDPGALSCDDLHRKIIALRVYFALIVLNFLFVVISTIYYIYRNVSAKWAQTSEPTINLNNQTILKQWQTYSLKKRGLFGTILGAIGHLIFSTTVLLYQVIVTSFTCEVYLWGPITGLYIWTYAIVWRTIRLHLLFRLNQLQQRFGDHNISEDKEYQWFMHHRGRATRYHLFTFLFSCFIIAMIIIIVECASIRINGTSQCQFYWGNYVVLSMVVFFFIVIFPFIVWHLRGNADAHGIRRELWVTMGVGVPCFVLFIVWQVLFEYPTDSKPAGTRGIFGPSNWIIIVTTTSHVMSVIMPLFKTLPIDKQSRRKSSTTKDGFHSNPTDKDCSPTTTIPNQTLELTTESLSSALTDPPMLRVLQSWAVKDFSVENILFYDRYLHLLQNVPAEPNNNILDTPLGTDQLGDAVKFYNTFIADQSPLQVNVSYRARSTADKAMEPLVHQQHRKHPMIEYDIPFITPINDTYIHSSPIELISSYSSHTLKRTASADISSSSTARFSDAPKITLQAFEPVRSEVFWNIFSGLFPKIVAAYNSESE